MSKYFIQYRRETLADTLAEYGGYEYGESTLTDARYWAINLKTYYRPVWRIVRLTKADNKKGYKMTSVHKLAKNRS